MYPDLHAGKNPEGVAHQIAIDFWGVLPDHFRRGEHFPAGSRRPPDLHPAVADVAVFGIPDPEFGEAVKAVVQPTDGVVADPSLARELIEYCGRHLAGFKRPKSIDFGHALPREPTGKLFKRKLKARYP